MKKVLSVFLFYLMFFVWNPIFALSSVYENPNMPKAYTIFSTKFAESTPFWIKIGDTKYYLIRNRADGNYTYKDIVGCDKSKKQLFEPFFEMNGGDRTKLTSEELVDADIRFAALKINGKLELNDKSKDFPLENIEYIDMLTTATYADRFLRPYGNFTMYVKTERGNLKKYIGHVDYQHPRYLEKMF